MCHAELDSIVVSSTSDIDSREDVGVTRVVDNFDNNDSIKTSRIRGATNSEELAIDSAEHLRSNLSKRDQKKEGIELRF